MQSANQKFSKLPAVIGGVVLLGAAAFIGWGIWQAMAPVAVPLQGMIDARTVSVAAKVPGRLAKVLVKEGDTVTAGMPVAELALPEINARVAQAKAVEAAALAKSDLAQEGARTQQIEAAKADLQRAAAAAALAKNTFARIDALYKEGLVSEQKWDEVRTQLSGAEKVRKAAFEKLSALKEGARTQEKAAAKALAAQAAGGVAEAESLAGEATVPAVTAGEVTRIVMHEGEVVPAGFPLVLVTDLTDSWAVFNVREDELPGIEKGTVLNAYLPALKKTVAFKVYWINPRGEYAVWRATRQSSGYDIRTFEVRARPVEPVANLRPGMTVVIERK